jgi:SP family galactose:H+ symporter-like MFS transporter
MDPTQEYAAVRTPGHREGTGRFVSIAAAISALGGLLFGYNTGVISGAILFIKQDFRLLSGTEEIIVSSAAFGALFGAAAGGILSDRFGRRRVIMVTAALFLVGAVGTALASTVNTLVAAQIVVGVAIGSASFTAPLYISEVSPPHVRGKMVALNQIALTVGIVLSYLVDYSFSAVRGWRWMFAASALPASVLGVGMFFMPESPRWLIKRGLCDAARSVLKRIRGTDDVETEVGTIRSGLGEQSGKWQELKSPLVRPALITGIGLAIFQQLTGINTVIYYAPTIFEFAGFRSASAAILATTGVGIVNVVMTVAARQLLDRVGRRPLLLVSLAGMVLGLTSLGIAFLLPIHSGVVGWLAVASLAIYVGSFALGLGPVFWLLIAEIYPLKIRGLAMSMATAANWGANLVVAMTFLTVVQTAGKPGTFWIYGLVAAGAWIFGYFLVPETRGRSLEEIEAHWRAGKHPREMGVRS